MKKYIIWIADGGIFWRHIRPSPTKGKMEPIMQRELYETLQEVCSLPPTWEDIASERAQCNTEDAILEKYAKDQSEVAIEKYLSKGQEREREDYELLDGIKEAITIANKKGVIQLVVGFRDPKTTQKILERFGIDQYLHVIPTETEGAYRLPNLKLWDDLIVKHFPEISDKDSKKVWFAKESAEMVLANKVTSLPFCWLKNAQGDSRRIFALKPAKTIGDIRAQILPMFEYFLGIDITEEDKLSMQKEEEREEIYQSTSPTLR